MRLRTAFVSVGMAALAVGAFSAPAQAAQVGIGTAHADTVELVGQYSTKSECTDLAQQYEREGWTAWCVYNGAPPPTWDLYIQN